MPSVTKKLTFIILILLACLLSLPTAYASVTIPPTWHGGKNPPDNCYISFSSTQAFNQVYRDSSNFWFFDGYGFYVTNANATITDFFESHQDKLEIRLSASSSQALADLRIKPSNRGIPNTLLIYQLPYLPIPTKQEFDSCPTTCWYYDSTNNIIYIKVELHSSATVTIWWTEYYPPIVPTPAPLPSPPPFPFPLPEPIIPTPPTDNTTLFIIVIVLVLIALTFLVLRRERK